MKTLVLTCEIGMTAAIGGHADTKADGEWRVPRNPR
jgi:hypothetical protein